MDGSSKLLQTCYKYCFLFTLLLFTIFYLKIKYSSLIIIFLARSALTNEKETFTIYKTQLGDEHEKTKESGKPYLQIDLLTALIAFQSYAIEPKVL